MLFDNKKPHHQKIVYSCTIFLIIFGSFFITWMLDIVLFVWLKLWHLNFYIVSSGVDFAVLFWIVRLSQALISIDHARARDDPVIVKNVPYYKAKKALETEVMKIDPPPRPPNCGVRIHYLHVMLASYSFLVIMIVQICLCLNNVHNFLSIYNVLLMIALAEFFLFH